MKKRKFVLGKFGLSDLSKFITDNQSLVQSGTNGLSGIINSLDSGNEVGGKSMETEIASSALSGASLGTSVMPVIGTGIGLGLGGLYGYFKNTSDKKKQRLLIEGQDRDSKLNSLSEYRDRVKVNPELVRGSFNNSYFANGGKLVSLTSNDKLVVGNSHEKGGVKFEKEKIELEGGETLNNDFVFSKRLGFADKHLKLINEKLKLEKLANKRPNDVRLINGIERIDYKIENLKSEQEQTKKLLNIPNDIDNEEFAKGGLLFTKDDLLEVNNNSELEDTKIRDTVITNSIQEIQNPSLFSSKGLGTPLKGSVAVSHNNPRNIKFGSFAKQFGAVEGRKATDGGRFAVFPSIEQGLKAGQELFRSKSYKDLSVDSALKRWSNNGYDGNIFPEIKNKKVKDLSDDELQELTKRQIKSEDRNMYNMLFKRFALGGYLKGQNGLTPEEIRTKSLMETYLRNLPNRAKRDSLRQVAYDKKLSVLREKDRIKKEETSKNIIDNFKVSKINNEVDIDTYRGLKKDSLRLGNDKDKKITSSKSISVKNQTPIKDSIIKGVDNLENKINEGTNNIKKTASNISDFFSFDKNRIEERKKGYIRPQGSTNISKKDSEEKLRKQNSLDRQQTIKNREQYQPISSTFAVGAIQRNKNEKDFNFSEGINKVKNFFGDLYPKVSPNSFSGANPITGQPYNSNTNSKKSVTPSKVGNNPITNKSYSDIFNPILDRKSLSLPFNNLQVTQYKRRPSESLGNTLKDNKSLSNSKSLNVPQSRNKVQDVKNNSVNLDRTTANNNVSLNTTPSTAGGDRFTAKPLRFNLDDNTLTKEELANQRKNQVRMLSDEELSKSPLKRKGEGLNLSGLGTSISQLAPDVINLTRNYGELDRPVLTSEINSDKINLNAQRVANNADYNSALNAISSLSSSNSAGMIGNLLSKKLRANNEISGNENNTNVNISNLDKRINSGIRQNNNALINQYNSDVNSRNIDIGNVRQGAFTSIASKVLEKNREDYNRDLDMAKLGINYSQLDEGTTNKVNSILGSDIRENALNSFSKLFRKKQKNIQ